MFLKQIHIMRGMSGSGKTTKADEILKDLPAKEDLSGVILATDDFFELTENGFNPSLLGTAHAWNFKRFIDCLCEGINVIIIDNTNTRIHEYQSYADMAEINGYELIVHDMNPSSPMKALGSALRNKHDVPLWKCFQQWERFEKQEGNL